MRRLLSIFLATLLAVACQEDPATDSEVSEESSNPPEIVLGEGDFYLYRSLTESFVDAELIYRGDKYNIKDSNPDKKNVCYYWIVCSPELTETFEEDRAILYRGMKVATKELNANLPVSVRMQIDPTIGTTLHKYQTQANYY